MPYGLRLPRRHIAGTCMRMRLHIGCWREHFVVLLACGNILEGRERFGISKIATTTSGQVGHKHRNTNAKNNNDSNTRAWENRCNRPLPHLLSPHGGGTICRAAIGAVRRTRVHWVHWTAKLWSELGFSRGGIFNGNLQPQDTWMIRRTRLQARPDCLPARRQRPASLSSGQPMQLHWSQMPRNRNHEICQPGPLIGSR